MQRYDVINHLIDVNGYKSYLEIGTQADKCLEMVSCEYKYGVDPNPVLHKEENATEFYQIASDDFFDMNDREYDIVFVDGLHEEEQVKRDIANALFFLRDGGCIVVHDCNPQEEINQEYPMPHVKNWNGTVWKAWVFFRGFDFLRMFVVDTDQGCGVIFRGEQKPLSIDSPTFEEFSKNRNAWLNLISIDKFYEAAKSI